MTTYGVISFITMMVCFTVVLALWIIFAMGLTI